MLFFESYDISYLQQIWFPQITFSQAFINLDFII